MKAHSVGLVCLLTPLVAFGTDPGSLALSVSNVTASSAELSWDFSGSETAVCDYIIVQSGTMPDENATPTGTLAFGGNQYSELWGKTGELWDPAGRLPNITDAGYMKGEVAIPEAKDWPVGENVIDHGAVGDGVNDDTQALRDAIAACAPNHAVYLPNGTYKITGEIKIDKDHIVIRGEDMNKTILKFPMGLRDAIGPNKKYTNWGGFFVMSGDVNPYSMRGSSTHRGIENLTFEFPEIPNREGHFSDYGANAITVDKMRDSWVRNVVIKNCNHGIILNGSNYITVTNIVFDNSPERVVPGGGDLGYAGHTAIKVTARFNVIHDVTFRGPDEYEHNIGFNGRAQENVISRVRGFDMQMDDHGGKCERNYFTEVNLGEGTPEVGRPTFRGANEHSIWWNIGASTDQPYEDADPKRTSVIVGMRTSDASDTANPEYWYETKTPALLHPQNIYLAQLEKSGKPLLGELLSPGGATAAPNPAVIPGLSSNTTYEIYVRSHASAGVPSEWTTVTSFTTKDSRGAAEGI